MKYIRLLVFAFVSISLLSSCSLFDSDKVNYFSISNPDVLTSTAKIDKTFKINVLSFKTKGPYSSKMVFTQPPHSVFFDSYNCWAQNPTDMLTNYFAIYIDSRLKQTVQSEIKKYNLSGTILAFSGDLADKTTNLSIELILKDNNGKTLLDKVYTETIEMKDLSASAFATSMSEAVNTVAGKFLTQIKKLN